MKTIVLNTIPHAGTHTMLYLFNFIGGIPIWWEHFDPNAIEYLYRAQAYVACAGREKYIFLQTERSYASLKESHDHRMITKGVPTTDYLDDCFAVREALINSNYPTDFILPLLATDEAKTEIALEVFEACEVKPPEEAVEYMKTWKPLNRRRDIDGRGMGDDWFRFRPILSKNRIKRMLQGEGHA